jgi:hypothetical protein
MDNYPAVTDGLARDREVIAGTWNDSALATVRATSDIGAGA